MPEDLIIEVEDFMLTTVDNPFDPFTEFDAWLEYDVSKGYNTCGYLADLVRTSSALSELDNEIAIQTAIDDIVKENPFGIHKKVLRSK